MSVVGSPLEGTGWSRRWDEDKLPAVAAGEYNVAVDTETGAVEELATVWAAWRSGTMEKPVSSH